MAATVTGVFRIIDRASKPMRDMRKEAEKLDKALVSAGHSMDDMGGAKHLKQFEDTERKIRDVDRTTTQLNKDYDSQSRLVRKLDKDTNSLSYKLGRLAAAFSGVGKVMKLIKMPALITGVAVLIQGVSALVGGTVALLPKITDLVGILGVAPATLTAVGLAAITAKVAFAGMGAAIKGTKGAMGKLTPEARAFVRELKSLKPIGKELRESAQSGLFPGLTGALEEATSKRPIGVAKRLLRGMGKTLGQTANQAAESFTSPSFLHDFESLGRQGEHLMSRLGSSIINVTHAMVDAGIAAKPFTSWLGNVIQNWSVGWREGAHFGRETGKLRGYFERTRTSLERFGSILSNLWGTFKGLGHAARPLGDDLWTSADKATERWDHFANSVAGQNELREYFDGLSNSLHAMFEFVGELSKAFLRLGQAGGLQDTAKSLTGALEPLETLFRDMAEKWAPILGETLGELARLINNLFTQGSWSGVTNVVKAFNSLLEAANTLLEKIPGLNTLFTGVLGAVTFNKLGLKLREIASDWGLVATNATRARIAQQEAAMPVAGGVVATGGVVPAGGRGTVWQRGGATVGRAGRAIGLGGITQAEQDAALLAAGGSVSGYGSTRYRMGNFGRQFAGVGGALAGWAGRGLAAAGRFLGPAAAFFAATNALNWAQTGERSSALPQAVASGATLGLIPEPETEDERKSKGHGLAQQLTQNVLRNTNGKGINALRQAAEFLRIGVKDPRELTEGGNTETSVLGGDTFNSKIGDKGAAAARKVFKKAIGEIETTITERGKQAGGKAADDFAKAWSIRMHHQGAEQAAEAMLGPVSKRLEHFAHRDLPGATRIFSREQLDWLRKTKGHNKKFASEYDELKQSIEKSFNEMGEHVRVVNGQIFTGSKSEWGRIAQALSSQAEKARDEVSESFTYMQNQAVGSLIAMGYSRPMANRIVQGMESKNNQKREAAEGAAAHGPGGYNSKILRGEASGPPNKGASGMRIPGTGKQDTVPLLLGMAAPGELVVNGWTERDVNRDLQAAGKPTLGQRVSREHRRHSTFSEHNAATGMRVPYAATGAILPAGRLATQMGMGVSGGPGYGGIPSSGHVSDSLHYQGLAYDVTGTAAQMRRYFFTALKDFRSSINELFYDPIGWYIDQGHKVAGAIGGHSDHVHIGFFPGGARGNAHMGAGLRGMLGGGGISVRSPHSKRGGAPGAMANRVMEAYAQGLQRKINKRIGGGAGTGFGGITGGGGKAANEKLGRMMMMQMWPASEWPSLLKLWTQESGWSETARNPSSGAYGIPQSLPASKMGAAAQGSGPAAAKAQIAWGLNYIKGRYGSPAAAWAHEIANNWYDEGGRIPSFAGWFRDGGSFVTDGPTVFGAGEGGERERVSITPVGKSSGGHSVTIHHMEIQNHRPGDIKKQVKDEVGAAFRELQEEMDLNFEEDGVLT